MRPLTRGVPFMLAAIAAACGGGGDGGGYGGAGGIGPDAACQYIYGGGTATLVTPGCATCTVDNAAAAIDGDPDTFATIHFPALAGGSMALRATAQDGVVYPANSSPGVLLSEAGGSNYAESGLVLRAYFQGAPVATSHVGSINGVGGGNSERGKYSMNAFVQFDAVEVEYSRGSGVDAQDIRVHEFCSD